MNREHKYGCRNCGDYIPPEGKVINGVVRFPGIGNSPTMPGNGCCQKAKKNLLRLKECPNKEEGKR